MTDRPLLASRQAMQCRICLETTDAHTFITPCDCRGSIEFVHRPCLREYLSHRFRTAPSAERRRMKKALSCQICKSELRHLRVQSARRCATCSELRQELQAEDVFFLVVFLVLYVGFHVVGVVIVMQDSLIGRIIGSFWLAATVIGFNYGLFRIVRKLLMVREATVKEIDR